MRSVSPRVRRGVALIILITTVTVVPAFADDPPPGFEPPQARIQIPVGVTSQPTTWELFLVWLQARIHVPIG